MKTKSDENMTAVGRELVHRRRFDAARRPVFSLVSRGVIILYYQLSNA